MAITVLPSRLYHRIDEASRLLECSTDDLLHSAIYGSVEMLAAVRDFWLLGVRFDTVTFERRYTSATTLLKQGFVALRGDSLRDIELFGKSEIREVDICYQAFSKHLSGPRKASDLFDLFEEKSGNTLENSIHFWRLCSRECFGADAICDDSNEADIGVISVHKRDLWLRTEELDRIRLIGKKQVSQLDHANRSNHLSLLNQASARFWTNADRNDGTTHPKNQDVAWWLEQRGLSPTLAAKAASIIRPEWAPVGRKPDK